MKKFITIAALFAAGTAFSNADTVSLLPSDTSITTLLQDGTHIISLGGWNNGTSATVNVTATDVASLLSNCSGWVHGCGTQNSSLPESGSFSVSYDADTASSSFLLTGRPAYYGVYTALVVSLNDVLSENTLTDLSVSFSSTASAGTFSAWTISSGSASNLIAEAALSNASSGFSTDLSSLTLSSSDKIVFLFNTQGAGGGTDVPVSNFMASATISAIPEPSAFGVLAGIGVLALVAARRRRSLK